MTISPTLEGFRATFRRPSFTLGEIAWRWVTGATATTLFLFGLYHYLDTLPVNSGELLFLRSRQPYLVAQALAHIFRGSFARVVISGLVGVLLIGLLWMVVGAVGRIATVGALLDYFRDTHFRRDVARYVSAGGTTNDGPGDAASRDVASNVSTNSSEAPRAPNSFTPRAFTPLVRLNFLRAIVAVAALFGFWGATILSSFVSPDAHPRPGLAFLLFLPLAGLIYLAWSSLNWLLALSGIFAVRDGEDAVGSIAAAVGFCRERAGAVAAVSTWTGLARLTAFVCMTTVISMPLGFAGFVPGRLILLVMTVIAITYFALADWLYMARLAGYVCIAETPEELLRPAPPLPPTIPPPPVTHLQKTIDRDELIMSDVPTNAPGAFYVQCDECIICRAPEAMAPDLIGFYKDPPGTSARSYCYFKKQPETPAELDRAVRAVWANCCASYHYAGADAVIKEKLKKLNCEWAIDNLG